jgi:hypothetical protein
MRIQPGNSRISPANVGVLAVLLLALLLTWFVLPSSQAQESLLNSPNRTIVKTIDQPDTRAHPAAYSSPNLATWLVMGSQPGSNFGTAVAYAGDIDNDGYQDVLVGANLYDGELPNQGQIATYYGTAAGLDLVPGELFSLPQEDAEYGRAVAAAGDVNNDGFADILSGAPYGGPDGRGVAYVDYGTPGGIQLGHTLIGQMPGDRFGFALAAADINNSGYTDVLVGAPGHEADGVTEAGAVFLYYGGPDGISDEPAWTVESFAAGGQLGYALAVGDFNGDGYPDIAIGAKHDSSSFPEAGAVFVFYGSAEGLPGDTYATPDNADWIYYGEEDFYFLGASLAAGDVNGNGFDDLIVGVPGYGFSGETWGGVYGFWGGLAGLGISFPDWSATEFEPDSWLGTAVALSDLNNNGLLDVLAGAPLAYTPVITTMVDPPGVVYAYMSSAFGPSSAHDWYLSSDRSGSQFGYALAASDDAPTNILVGAPQYSDLDGNNLGAVFGFNIAPMSTLTASNDSPTSLGNATSFAAFLENGESAEFEWAFGDGNMAAGQFVTHTYEQPRIYTAVVTATNPFGTTTAETTVIVNVRSEINPGSGGTLDFLSPMGWGINVEVPTGAVDRRIGLAYLPLDPNEIEEPLPPNASTYFFDIDPVELDPFNLYLPLILNEVITVTGQPETSLMAPSLANTWLGDDTFPFLLPITVTVTYTDTQIIGLDEEDLILTYWDSSIGAWLDAATTCDDPAPYVRDLANNRFTLQICHLSRFGMVGN